MSDDRNGQDPDWSLVIADEPRWVPPRWVMFIAFAFGASGNWLLGVLDPHREPLETYLATEGRMTAMAVICIVAMAYFRCSQWYPFATGWSLLGFCLLAAFQSVVGLKAHTMDAWLKVFASAIGIEKSLKLMVEGFPFELPPWTPNRGWLTLRAKMGNPGRYVYWQRKQRLGKSDAIEG